MWIMAWRMGYSREFRESAVALVFEQVEQHVSQWEAICTPATEVYET
jgi:transposase-like protein